MKYKKINKDKLYNFMLKYKYAGFIEIIHSPKWLANGLKTSRYQVNKYIKELLKNNLIEYKTRLLCLKDYESGLCYCENHLPEQGYILKELK